MIKTTFIRFFTLLIFFSLLPIAVENSFPELDGYNLQAEEKKKKDAKIAVAVEMLKDELAALGEEPVIDTSDIDSDEDIKALKKQIKDIKEKRKA